MDCDKAIYDDGSHKCVIFSIDNEEIEDKFLAVNVYLIIQNNSAILIDPGSQSSFDDVYELVTKYIKIEQLRYVFFSHQDPDVADSISSWAVCCNAKLIVSKLWSRFLTHYGLSDMSRLIELPDKGAKISFNDDFIHFIPAHFLHSPGNFSLYDARSQILFSGDIGASITHVYGANRKIEDFDLFKKDLEIFHKRYMAGNVFCKAWVSRVNRFDIKTIAPQHGAIFVGKSCDDFFKWFGKLRCGGDLIRELY